MNSIMLRTTLVPIEKCLVHKFRKKQLENVLWDEVKHLVA